MTANKKKICDDCIENSIITKYLKEYYNRNKGFTLDNKYSIRFEGVELKMVFVLVDLEINTKYGDIKVWIMNVNNNNIFRFYAFADKCLYRYYKKIGINNYNDFKNYMNYIKNNMKTNELSKLEEYKREKVTLARYYKILDYALNTQKQTKTTLPYFKIKQTIEHMSKNFEPNRLFLVCSLFKLLDFNITNKRHRYYFAKIDKIKRKLPNLIYYVPTLNLETCTYADQKQIYKKLSLEEFSKLMEDVPNDTIEELISKHGGTISKSRNKNIKKLLWYLFVTNK